MPGFLKSRPISDEQRVAHDRHRTAVVLAVLATLAAYLYLFTPLGHAVGLPLPGAWVDRSADLPTFVENAFNDIFDDSGVVSSEVGMAFATRITSVEQGLLVFLVVLVPTFLAAYYLPLRHKQHALLAGALVMLLPVYGFRVTAGLLCMHVLAHQAFHPTRRWPRMLLPGALAAVAFAPPEAPALRYALWFVSVPCSFAVAYRFLILPLLERPRIAPWVQGIVAHSAVITIVLFAIARSVTGHGFAFQVGIILFFWQWSRLILYHLDFRAGMVPRDTPLARYLAVFLSPGAIPGWNWGVELGLGYAYCNNAFLARDKNRIVMSGVSLLWTATIYLVFGDWLRHLLSDGLAAFGVDTYGDHIVWMVDAFMKGDDVSTTSVLATSLLDTIRWSIWFVGIVHFKTGVWRICGYDFEPYFSRPWLATNLVVFWARYTYYFREFLLQTFYYPVFLRFFRGRPRLRIFVATVAAAGLGNLVWGHLTERMYDYGMTTEQLRYTLHTWPYYALLSGGIALTALYLLEFSRRKRRRPWTPGPKLATDVLASFGTFQYFSIIHIMSRPSSGSTEWDLFRLMLRGLGIHL